MVRLIGPVILFFLLTGCGSKPESEADSNSPVRRVVCGSPAVAEIVFALDCGDRVVGVSEHSNWPPEAAAKSRIGGALSPNRERILALEPDLILGQGKSIVLGGFADSQGIPFHSYPLDTLKELQTAIAGFAAALGAEEAGQELLGEMESGFAVLPACASVPVFIALGHAPGDLSGLMTSGPDTFLSQIVTKAGGRNIFADMEIDWPRISRETLVRRKPEMILDFQSGPVDDTRWTVLIADWKRLGFKAGQVRVLSEDYLLKPGPRAVQSAVRIADAICGKETQP